MYIFCGIFGGSGMLLVAFEKVDDTNFHMQVRNCVSK